MNQKSLPAGPKGFLKEFFVCSFITSHRSMKFSSSQKMSTKLYGKDVKEYEDVDIDTLLAKLTAEELEELNNEVDPDVSRVALEICPGFYLKAELQISFIFSCLILFLLKFCTISKVLSIFSRFTYFLVRILFCLLRKDVAIKRPKILLGLSNANSC